MDNLPTTIEECHQVIRLLLSQLDALSKRVDALQVENAQLKERLNNNSSNSSLPPSKRFKRPKNNRQPSGKKAGGHAGHHRMLLPVEEVSVVQSCELPMACTCGEKIKSAGKYVRHQVYELPEMKLNVTEYQLQQGYCDNCGRKHVAAMRAVADELLPIVKEENAVNVDETGDNRDGKKHWVWGFISPTAAFFLIHASRGKKVLHTMLSDFKNIVISDRYVAYTIFDSSQRQLGWAHLKRDLTKLAEKENKLIARIGKSLLECESNLFKVWHEYKAEKILPDELLRQTKPIRARVGELLEQGTYTDPALKAARFCKNLLENYCAMDIFADRWHRTHEQSCRKRFKIVSDLAKKIFLHAF